MLYIGADHRGYNLKEALKAYLKELNFNIEDMGAFELNPEDDYPDFIIPLARAVSQDPDKLRGIILGGSGQGEAMTANKFSNVRAAVYYGEGQLIVNEDNYSIIKLSREHNDANILSLGARFITEDEMMRVVREWLNTSFDPTSRHKRRLDKMNRIHE